MDELFGILMCVVLFVLAIIVSYLTICDALLHEKLSEDDIENSKFLTLFYKPFRILSETPTKDKEFLRLIGSLIPEIELVLKKRFPYIELNYNQFQTLFNAAPKELSFWTFGSKVVSIKAAEEDADNNRFERVNINAPKKDVIDCLTNEDGVQVTPLLFGLGDKKEMTFIFFSSARDKKKAYELIEKYIRSQENKVVSKQTENRKMQTEKVLLTNAVKGAGKAEIFVKNIRAKAEQQVADCQAQMLDLTTKTLNEREQPRLDFNQTEPVLKL